MSTPSNPFKRLRILVIDDYADLLDIMEEMLTDAGYQVLKTTSGEEGVRMYRREPFDLVVTDLFMPEKDGLEVVMELGREFPHVKIITLSGGSAYGYSSLESAKLLGAARALQKPFTEEDLLRAVREVLESGE